MSMKSIEVSGKNEDEAIEKALELLGLSRDDVSVEIIERAKTGFLGLKNTPAIVKVVYEDESADGSGPGVPVSDSDSDSGSGPDPIPHPAKKEKFFSRSDEKRSDEKRNDENKVVVPSGKKDTVENFLIGLFEKMDVTVDMKVTETADCIDVSLKASSPGTLIGRRGETLDAIQHLTNYVVNRGSTDRTRINVDAEGYRQRRNETLEGVAAKAAAKVLKNRRNMTLEPMNAYERHVIHTTLQEHENINTFSVGSEPNRRVVVAYGKSGDSGGGFNRGKRPPRSSFGESSRSTGFEDSVTESPAPASPPAPRPAEDKSYREWS